MYATPGTDLPANSEVITTYDPAIMAEVSHPTSAEIADALAQGLGPRQIAEQYGISRDDANRRVDLYRQRRGNQPGKGAGPVTLTAYEQTIVERFMALDRQERKTTIDFLRRRLEVAIKADRIARVTEAKKP